MNDAETAYWDDAYTNSAYIPGGDTYRAKWAAAAETFRTEMSRMNAITRSSFFTLVKLNEISTGNSLPSFRSAVKSRPAPIRRGIGFELKALRKFTCPFR